METLISIESTPKPKKFLGVFTLAMLSASAIISLRNLPTTALLGTQSITFFLAAGFGFFIPIALACAELASSWSKKGGVYLWIEEAFGKRTGFFAVWLQWIESVIWLPTILSFVAATTAYLFDPLLEQNKLFLALVMLFVLWGITFLNFRGIRTSSFLSSMGVVLGTILPGIVLIILGFTQIPQAASTGLLQFRAQDFIPSGELTTLVTYTAILLGLCGMEIPAYYVQNVRHPKQEYPKAMFLATAIILIISVFGSLAIAAVVPRNDISLIAGPMQAFHIFFESFGIGIVSPLLAALTLIGSLALLNTWIIGPSKGLLASSEEGFMPKLFRHTNKAEVPTHLLYLQAICGTLLIVFFVYNPSIKAAYWMITTLAAQLYLIMYFIVFLAVIRLRYSQPATIRAYKIPGGMLGVWIVCGVGALGCLLAFLIGFVRPSDFVHHSELEYALWLAFGIVISCVPPFFLLNKKKNQRKIA